MNQMLKGQCALQIGQSSCYFAMQIWLRGRLDEWNGWERKWIVPKQMRSQDQNLYTAQMENDAAMTCYCIPKTCNETVFFSLKPALNFLPATSVSSFEQTIIYIYKYKKQNTSSVSSEPHARPLKSTHQHSNTKGLWSEHIFLSR